MSMRFQVMQHLVQTKDHNKYTVIAVRPSLTR